MRRWWQREPKADASLIGTVQRIEKDLATHTAAFREYAMATDIRLELIDVLTTKVLPQLSRALTDQADSNRALAASQAKINDTFERILAALPTPGTAMPVSDNHVAISTVRDYR